MISVVIADRDLEFCEQLHEKLFCTEKFLVVGLAHDAEECVKTVERLKPQMIIMDPYLQNIDGLDVIRKICSMPAYNPMIYIITRFSSYVFNLLLEESGVDLITAKPANIDHIVTNLAKAYGLCFVNRE